MKSLASVAIVFTLLQSPVAYAAWDATADFNATTITNPNGVWSYGYDPAAMAGYQLKTFDLFTTAGTLPLAWQDSSYVYSNAPSFEKNTAASRIAGTLPGQIALHPGPVANGDAAILRFTAPQTGSYSIRAQFLAGDLGETDAWVVLNNDFLAPLGALGTTNLNPKFSIGALSLAADDTVDFVVGNRGSYFGDTTPLTVQISVVPEPGIPMLLLLGLGCIGLRVRARRSKEA